MKRIIFICSLILLNVNVMAQYYKGSNYQVTFEDDFDIDNRAWNMDNFHDTEEIWQSYLYGYRLTHGPYERQVYQPSQCIFDADAGMAKLVADYISPQITCDEVILPTIPQDVRCYDDELERYKSQYFSGALVSVNNGISYHKYKYGYFEIRCKLPVHKGAFPAFWLWDSKTEEYYEEIDIFEYSWGIANNTPNSNGPNDNRCFTTGIYYNETGTTDSLITLYSYGRTNIRVPDSSPSMDEWNTFGCLWLPDRVEWYINDTSRPVSSLDSMHRPLYETHMEPCIKASNSISSGMAARMARISSRFNSRARTKRFAPRRTKDRAVAGLQMPACVEMWISILGHNSRTLSMTPRSATMTASTRIARSRNSQINARRSAYSWARGMVLSVKYTFLP